MRRAVVFDHNVWFHAAMAGPDDRFEREARARGFFRVAGVDEVGRGPLAGPVVAAAVVLDPARVPDGLNDSKVLSAARREALFALILEVAEVGVGVASVAEIDALNILRASHLAMTRAIAALPAPPDFCLIDGNLIPRDLALPAAPIIRGDALSVSIAAASIVAKTRRDALMVDLAQQHPGYGWETNAGYPTKAHRSALENLGVTPHHRRSFKPVHNILYQGKFTSR
jgi:ribonuclease HII